jgi:hypothetical protein
VAIVEQVCRASGSGSLLHDDYSNIAHLEVEIGIDIEGADSGGRQDGAGGEGEDLVMVAQGLGIWKEQAVGEMVLQVRIERVRGAGRGAVGRQTREQLPQQRHGRPSGKIAFGYGLEGRESLGSCQRGFLHRISHFRDERENVGPGGGR